MTSTVAATRRHRTTALPTAGTRARALAIARGELGTRESPAGSNRVKYSLWYRLIGPWCAMFTSWVLQEAGLPRWPLTHGAYTPYVEAAYRKAGRFGSTPRVGALVLFNFIGRTSHIGIVEAVNRDGTITTIEGNTDSAGGRTGGRVMRQIRSRLIVGYCYPPYADDDAVPDPGPADNEESSVYYCKQGEKNRDVATAQRRLNRALPKAQRITVDGDYGAETVKAVKAVAGGTGKSIGSAGFDKIETAIADRRAAIAVARVNADAPHRHKATVELT